MTRSKTLALALGALLSLPLAAFAGQRSKIIVKTGQETNGRVQGLPIETLYAPLLDLSGQTVGKLDVTLTITLMPQDPDDPGSGFISGVATLPLGQITVQGALDNGDDPFKLAITGGTGAYRNARGYVRVRPTEQSAGSRITFHVTH